MYNKSEHSFKLKNSNEAFMARQKNVFDQLNNLQCNLRREEEMDVDETSSRTQTNKSVTKHFKGKESIFKAPQLPVRRHYLKTIPDFKKNPHKWTKYSLADVKDEDMSEASNTKAALSFLNELRNRNNRNKESQDSNDVPKKIVFQKSGTASSTSQKDEESKPSFIGSKVVMPEYVVGQKIKKEKKKQKTVLSDTQLKLDHLYEDD